jgi:hypothetical protein
VLADGLQLVVDLMRLDAARTQRLAEGVGHGAQDAVLESILRISF